PDPAHVQVGDDVDRVAFERPGKTRQVEIGMDHLDPKRLDSGRIRQRPGRRSRAEAQNSPRRRTAHSRSFLRATQTTVRPKGSFIDWMSLFSNRSKSSRALLTGGE